MAKYKKRIKALQAERRAQAAAVSWPSLLQSFSDRLSNLREENAQVMERVQRNDKSLEILHRDIVLAIQRMATETAERDQLRQERDELVRELERGEEASSSSSSSSSPSSVVEGDRTSRPHQQEQVPLNVSPGDDAREVANNKTARSVAASPADARETAKSTATAPNGTNAGINGTNHGETGWKCSACTFENDSSTDACAICGTSTSAIVQESAPAFISMLLEMGYKQTEIDEAIQALDDTDKRKPEAVIFWIDERAEKKRLQEEERRKQERVEKERLAKEREAKERAARKKAKLEAQKRSQQEAEDAQERKAKEEAEKARREAREAKERARIEAEQARMASEAAAKDQERNIRDGVAKTPSVVADLSLEEKPVSTNESAKALATPKDTKVPAVKLIRPSISSSIISSHKSSTGIGMDPSKLSQYMYSDLNVPGTTSKKQSRVSPIFAMLRDPSTVESARILLSLEQECAKLKKDADNARREKDKVDRSVVEIRSKEADLDAKLQARINHIDARVHEAKAARQARFFNRKELATKTEVVYELKRLEALPYREKADNKDLESRRQDMRIIERHESEEANRDNRKKEAHEWRESEQERLEEELNELLAGDVAEAESRYNAKLKLVEKKRDEIIRVKQTGEREDPRFDINDSRDEHGHTFLMVATQNNDIETARLCLELGATPLVKCASGLTAMGFAQFFKLDQMAAFLAESGGAESSDNIWSMLDSKALLNPIDWETQLKLAENAAIPADTKLSSGDDFVSVSDSTTLLDTKDRQKVYGCFDASLLDPEATNFSRIVLLEKDVYSWFAEANTATRSVFYSFLNRLKCVGSQNGTGVSCHRRFVVGVKREKQFEVLCAELTPGRRVDAPVSNDALIAFYSPYVEGYINGVSNIGVLLWAVTTERRAAHYVSLIETAEFNRHKRDDPEEVFPPHRSNVLELGKDMHLLDLKATSIFTGSAMELLSVNLDKDLERMERKDFIPKKRLLHHEQQLQQALFRSSEKESSDNEAVVSMTRPDLSTNLSGGAGTGKTMILIKKTISEDADKRILVVSRLPRLISFVKSAVDAERDTSNVTFFTYEDLLNHLARRIEPEDGVPTRTFAAFNQVHFGETTGTGASATINFESDFVGDFLEQGERRSMKEKLVEPITLWGAFRVIKSSAKCSETKMPLSREDYMKLPRSFGLNQEQRALVYKLYLRYAEWLESGSFKWDEADRVLYILRWGPSVFSESELVSWEERAYRRGEMDLLDEDEMPLAPFFFHMVFADEAQDFSDLDLSLFVRMSSSVRSLLLGADPAQSVELGIKMREGTVNNVFHACLPKNQKNAQVKTVLQSIHLKTNHRTHARNLEIGKAVRKILTRSFGVPASHETALIEGSVPEALLLSSMRDLADDAKFRGGNVVFIAPDETVNDVRSLFLELGIKNDVFGVREAKGLEFPSIALVGFFEFFEAIGNQAQWENVIRWLFSTKGVTTTESAEKIQGKCLENCDYVLSHPEVEDQAMVLYTAMTRARGHLYFIEVESGKKRKGKGGLAEFAFRQLQQLRLLKIVSSVDEGEAEMTPQEHKARGVLLVVQAINMSRTQATNKALKKKFADAQSHFQVNTGNDQHLLDQSNKHLRAILMKRALKETVRTTFFDRKTGKYDLQGRFEDVLKFEREAAEFFRLCANDSFLVEEIGDVRALIDDVFYATPYYPRFGEICEKLKQFQQR